MNDATKILIVEDEVLIRKAYTEELQSEGFTVIVAGNGKEGLDTALAEKPDLILLDILMPIMDGVTMMGKLRESGEYGAQVPIILLTNLSTNEEKILEAVVKDKPALYLEKASWDLAKVVEKIKEYLKDKPEVV
jgi:DNA-binding response OmpR family regulator